MIQLILGAIPSNEIYWDGIMYKRKSRLGSRQQGKLLERFVAGATVRAAVEVLVSM